MPNSDVLMLGKSRRNHWKTIIFTLAILQFGFAAVLGYVAIEVAYIYDHLGLSCLTFGSDFECRQVVPDAPPDMVNVQGSVEGLQWLIISAIILLMVFGIAVIFQTWHQMRVHKSTENHHKQDNLKSEPLYPLEIVLTVELGDDGELIPVEKRQQS